MYCSYPKQSGNGLRPCGGCWPCRINKRREWTGRILLESLFWPETSFVTLTYDDAHLPMIDGLPVVYRKDYDRFKRQFKRSAFGPTFRYYGVAEYGDETFRPHYHFIMFGVGPGWLEEIRKAWSVRIREKDVTPKAIKEKRIFRDHKGQLREQLGYVTSELLVPERAAYAARYTAKKMNKPDDTRLKGRTPEFRSMSKQQGGLGVSGLGWLADMHATNAGSKALLKNRDVFNGIKVEGKVWPIGEYLRSQLRELVGVEPNQAKRDLNHDDYQEDLVFAPPMDLYSVRGLPRNRRVLDGEAKEKALDSYIAVEKNQRREKRKITRGAKI